MSTRNRNLDDWDPMKEDYDDTNYDPQYPDDSGSQFVGVDHTRLYITNLPPDLDDTGLETLFSKYGVVERAHVHRSENKNYAFIHYTTSSEAKLAMMKLNGTEPMRLRICFAHKKENQNNKNTPKDKRENRVSENKGRKRDSDNKRERDDTSARGSVRDKDDNHSVSSHGRDPMRMINGTSNDFKEDLNMDLDPELQIELERIQLEKLKLQQAQLQCKERLLIKQAERRAIIQAAPVSRCVLPGGKVVIRSGIVGFNERSNDEIDFGAGGDSNSGVCPCSKLWEKMDWSMDYSTSIESEYEDLTERTETDPDLDYSVDSETLDDKGSCSESEDILASTKVNREILDHKNFFVSVNSTIKEVVNSESVNCLDRNCIEGEKVTECNDDRYAKTVLDKSIDIATDFEEDKIGDVINLRNSDYSEIVDDNMKIVIALVGYPVSKMGLCHISQFQHCLSGVVKMQVNAGLLSKPPSFLDYYLNRGAIVCICKNKDTRDWILRISPGLQERMSNDLIFLKTAVEQFSLALFKIPKTSEVTAAQDVLSLLQYFNPKLRTDKWTVYSQETVEDVDYTYFRIDRISVEIIRGRSFKNIIDFNQIGFELIDYGEVFSENFASEVDKVTSYAFRVKLLKEIKSAKVAAPNHKAVNIKDKDLDTKGIYIPIEVPNESTTTESLMGRNVLGDLTNCNHSLGFNKNDTVIEAPVDESSTIETLKVKNALSDLTNLSETNKNSKNSVLETNIIIARGNDLVKDKESLDKNNKDLSIAQINSIAEDNDCKVKNLVHNRRTNYSLRDNKFKIALTLEGYPQNQLKKIHLRRLKLLLRDFIINDIENRSPTEIKLKFQDIYLSNGAMIIICDNMETKNYLSHIMPVFISSMGLKMFAKDIDELIGYTRVIMTVPKQFSHIGSIGILSQIQCQYPDLNIAFWRYYSDVIGRQKREFGLDPGSLKIIQSDSFNPIFDDEKINFQVVDENKTVVARANVIALKDKGEEIVKSMYSPINGDEKLLEELRSKHYCDVVSDDLKLYISSIEHPQKRIEEALFCELNNNLEELVCESFLNDNITQDTIPKFHDIYLFDGVTFVICKDKRSKEWLENAVPTLSKRLSIDFKYTEVRGAVGIVTMSVKAEMNVDDVINILQIQNPKLRTKFWRKIKTINTKSKLVVTMQIDKLSAEVIVSPNFVKFIGTSPVEFDLDHLQSLIKSNESLEKLNTDCENENACREIATDSDHDNDSIAKTNDINSEELPCICLFCIINSKEIACDGSVCEEGVKNNFDPDNNYVTKTNVINSKELTCNGSSSEQENEIDFDPDTDSVIEVSYIHSEELPYSSCSQEINNKRINFTEEKSNINVNEATIETILIQKNERSKLDSFELTGSSVRTDVTNGHGSVSINVDKVVIYNNHLLNTMQNINNTSTTTDMESQKFDDTKTEKQKSILKIPSKILPEDEDDLNIIFQILKEKNPGLKTELWELVDTVFPENGKITLLIDKQSLEIIKSKHFDQIVGGEMIKFFF